MFDAYGDFNERIIANLNILLDAPPEVCSSYTTTSSVSTAKLHQGSSQEPDWHALRPFFAWTSPSSIKDTFNDNHQAWNCSTHPGLHQKALQISQSCV